MLKKIILFLIFLYKLYFFIILKLFNSFKNQFEIRKYDFLLLINILQKAK